MDPTTVSLIAKLCIELGAIALGKLLDGKEDEITIGREVLDNLAGSYPEYAQIIEMARAGELNAAMLGDGHKTPEELREEVDNKQ